MWMLRRDVVLLSYATAVYSLTVLMCCFVDRRHDAPVYVTVSFVVILGIYHSLAMICGVLLARTVDKELKEEALARIVDNELKVPLACTGDECV